ncbi:C39 family peptidase [Gordonibacter sp. 28C]|uniref:C39 family peptidase n=1 Tax=Gordonibacter sp. 28C TaxID=2078569 RepID=UPI0011C0407D|nr:C39 family peptidase [Gordonibacter sp. 28C]
MRDVASRLFGILGPRGALVAAGVVAIVLVAVVVFAVRVCAGDAQEPAGGVQTAEEQGQEPAPETVSVPDYLDADLAASLMEAAKGNADVAWVANHADEYAVDGDAVQYKLLKLAASEPEAVPFVRAFPERYPADAGEASGGERTQGGAPLLFQWDQRWGYTVYSSTTFALTGCCPTSLSMVYQSLTGKSDLSPYDLGVRAREGGYETQFDGTDATFLLNEAPSLGLSCAQIDVNADALAAALAGGGLVICNVGPGDFTSAGHFFVIAGLNDDGSLVVNDPYSAERSAKGWDVGQVLGQTQALYAYRRA